MADTVFDLPAYLARIGYGGSREPVLSTLRAVVAGHAMRIPFENLDVLLGRPIRLDTAALAQKLVAGRRGGYCFEHNALLLAAIEALGFSAEGLAARVVWMRGPDDIPPRTHMLLRVRLPEGEYLADVGFGGLTLTAPLVLAAGHEQETPHEPHRLIAVGNELELQARLGDDWTRLYRFSSERQYPIDYAVANWFTSTHPEGLFTNNLLCHRPDAGVRYALFNREFTIRYTDGRAERRSLQGAAELGEVLARYFLVDLPPEEIAAVSAAVDRAVAGPPKTAG